MVVAGGGAEDAIQTDKDDITTEFQFTTDVAALSKRSIEVRHNVLDLHYLYFLKFTINYV